MGSIVEANYQGKRGQSYYRALIVAVHNDETYDVDYKDSDFDSRLSAKHIRLLPASQTLFKLNDRVLAKYQGMKGGQFYADTIVGSRPENDQFDVNYDDGDRLERRVHPPGYRGRSLPPVSRGWP